eukprot:g26964.t1
MINLSKHFIIMEVKATRQQSLRYAVGVFFDAGMVVFLKQVDTSCCSRERLKMSVNTHASWYVQDLSARLEIPCGPVIFHGFTLKKAVLTSAVVTKGTDVSQAVGTGDTISLTFSHKPFDKRRVSM